MKSVVIFFVLLIITVDVIAKAVLKDVDEIPKTKDIRELDGIIFDFIVVGAGASGCIVASRLANETNKRVLLLEGGAKGTGQRDIGGTDYVASSFVTNPITGKQQLGIPLTRYDFPLMADTVRQAADVLDTAWNITGIGMLYRQAKAVGGNQAANGAAWLVPQKHDLDAWGIPGYYSEEFWPYFIKLSNATATGFTSDRGTSGPIHIEFASFTPKEQSMFVDAAALAGYPFGGDVGNGSIGRGYYYMQMTTKQGIRQSTSITYLAKVLATRPNIEFRTSAIVTRVLFDIFNNAIGVEYQDEHGHLRKVFALKEVILSTGALHTPKVLYNSGIGPESILTAFDKPHRVINEIVGQKIRSQQRAILNYYDSTFQLPNFYVFPATSVEFARSGTGLLSKQQVILSAQISPTAPYPELYVLAFNGGYTQTDPYGQFIQTWVYLNQQIYANGTLNLTDTNPLGGTIFRENAIAVDADAELIAKGLLELRRVMTYWNGSLTEIAPGLNYTTVEDLIPYVKATGATSCHQYSSVPMGTDSSFPLDPRMKVRGVHRLRVISAAAVPGSVYFGMQALAMAMGEKGVDLIKEDYGL